MFYNKHVTGRRALRINDEFTIDIMPSIAGHTWQEMRGYIETVDLTKSCGRVALSTAIRW
jgi:hypothetical protein